MKKYKQLAVDLYIEPEPAAKEIVDSFLDPAEKDYSITTTSKLKKKEPKMKETTASCVLQRDVWTFF